MHIGQYVEEMTLPAGSEAQPPRGEKGSIGRPKSGYGYGERHQPGHDPQEAVAEGDRHCFRGHHLHRGHHRQIGDVDESIANGDEGDADHYAAREVSAEETEISF